MGENKFVKRKEFLEKVKIHYHTLYKLVREGKIEVIKLGNQNLYNLNKFLRENTKYDKIQKRNICYCRVSSLKQRGDLERQVNVMKQKYPTYEIIQDIGSGLNFKRKGLIRLMDISIRGELNNLVIAYKDRLARIGYEMLEYIIKKYSNGKIKILNKEQNETPTEELTKDLISIMNIYVAKVNGMRKYKNS